MKGRAESSNGGAGHHWPPPLATAMVMRLDFSICQQWLGTNLFTTSLHGPNNGQSRIPGRLESLHNNWMILALSLKTS